MGMLFVSLCSWLNRYLIRYKKNLKALYIVHPSTWPRLILGTMNAVIRYSSGNCINRYIGNGFIFLGLTLWAKQQKRLQSCITLFLVPNLVPRCITLTTCLIWPESFLSTRSTSHQPSISKTFLFFLFLLNVNQMRIFFTRNPR